MMNNMQCPLSRKPAKQCLKVPFSNIVTPIIVWQCKLLIQTLHCISFHVVLSWCLVFVLFFLHFPMFISNKDMSHSHFCGKQKYYCCSWNVIPMVNVSHMNTYHRRWRHVPPVVEVSFHRGLIATVVSVHSVPVSWVFSPKTAMLCVYTVRAPWKSSFPRRRAASCSPFTTTVP